MSHLRRCGEPAARSFLPQKNARKYKNIEASVVVVVGAVSVVVASPSAVVTAGDGGQKFLVRAWTSKGASVATAAGYVMAWEHHVNSPLPTNPLPSSRFNFLIYSRIPTFSFNYHQPPPHSP